MNEKNRISALQELLVAKNLPLPIYNIRSYGTSFKCTVKAAGVVATRVAPTKQGAKHASARAALEKLKSFSGTPQTSPVKTSSGWEAPCKNNVESFASNNGDQYPAYTLPTNSNSSQSMYENAAQGNGTYEVGSSGKDAKQYSATKIPELVKPTQPVITAEINFSTTIEVSLASLSLNDDQAYTPNITCKQDNPQSLKPNHVNVTQTPKEARWYIYSGSKAEAAMNGKTPISVLQELMAAKRLPMPVYTEESYESYFQCTVWAAGKVAIGVAFTKKGAKHESANSALKKLGMFLETPGTIPVKKSEVWRDYVSELSEFASKSNLRYPDYTLLPGSSGFIYKCSFQGNEEIGFGTSKKDAKQDSARKMLELRKL